MTAETDAKAAAVEQWTADPCGSQVDGADPGSRTYFEQQLDGRDEYAPWMHEALDYASAKGERVLDIGCGQGMDVARYALAGADVTGIDLTPRHVELAGLHTAALGLAAEVIEGDAENLPFPDASFDRVSSNGVLHHTPDMPAALCEAHRVLRPGGEARIIVYNRNSLHYWLNQFFFRGIVERGLFRERSMAGVLSSGVERSSIGAKPLVRVYTRRQLRRLLLDAGFHDVTVTVRHFRPGDTFLTQILAHRLRLLRDPAVLERLGRLAGWYVIARGRA